MISIGEINHTGNIENHKGFSKKPLGILFPIGEEYFIQEFDSDK